MFGDIGKLMKIAGDIKTKMPALQEKLANSRFTAEAGGVVAATVSGRLLLTDIRIDPSLLADEALDAEMLADLVKAAVSAAQEKAARAAAEAMRQLTGGVQLPGLEGLF